MSKALTERHAQKDVLPDGQVDIELNNDIAYLTITKRRLRAKSDEIIDALLSSPEELAEKAESYDKKLKAVSVIDRANIENKSLKKLRAIDTTVRLHCEQAALRQLWTANTFPFFEQILQLEDSDSNALEQAKSLAHLALYHRAKLQSEIEGDNELLNELDMPSSDILNMAPISLKDTDKMTAKIRKKTEKAYQEYLSLVESRGF